MHCFISILAPLKDELKAIAAQFQGSGKGHTRFTNRLTTDFKAVEYRVRANNGIRTRS